MRRSLMRRYARLATGGATDMVAALPQHAIGTDIGITTWDTWTYQRIEANGGGFTGFNDDTDVAADASGYPLTGGWSRKLSESAGRGNFPRVPLGVWKVVATPRTSGTQGVWSMRFNFNASLSNVVYDLPTNTVTADLTVSSTENTIAIRCTEPITDLRIVRPGVSTSTTQYFSDEAIGLLKQYADFRPFNLLNLNTGAGFSPQSFAAWGTTRKHGDYKGWGFIVDLFLEVHNAPGSNCKFLQINIPPYWDDTDAAGLAAYLNTRLPPTAGVIIAGVNETWNSIYPTMHHMQAQLHGYPTHYAGAPGFIATKPMARADRVRVAKLGTGNAWKANVASFTGSTVTLAAGGEGSVVAGDSINFNGHGSTYTVATGGGLADVAAGGTITFTSAVNPSLTIGAGIEVNRWDAWGRWWALREARFFKAFRDEFGAAWGARIFSFAQTHFVNKSWHEGLYLPFLNEPTQTAEFGSIANLILAIGGAPYPTLSLATYQACTSAADIVDKLRNSTSANDVTLAGTSNIPVFWAQWETIRQAYGIRYHFNYELGFEHQGYIPWPTAPIDPGTGQRVSQFYVSPYWIEAMDSAGFRTFCDDVMSALRASTVRLVSWLNAMSSTYIAQPVIAPGGENVTANYNSQAANSAWGSINSALAATYAGNFDLNTSPKGQAIRAHMLVTGQLP